MQMPPAETIPTMPDDTNPGPVPPMGPGTIVPDDDDDLPFPGGEDPGDNPNLPPGRDPFPDDLDIPATPV